MTDERRQRIEALFSQAYELPEGERARFLSEASSGDAEIQEAVHRLLREVERSEAYLRGLARRVGLPGPELSPEGLVGRSVGSYRLVRLLGRGGMGAVYLGEREEGGFRLQAAVKIVATGVLSQETRLRFLGERRILASLRHPNIARLFDGGFTEDGTPYFVMEYVDGAPIHEHCDRNRSTIEERIALVLEVCKAVQHAHQNLVIHRDLKPGNVLVTADGEVKLLDFGIARVLDAGEGTDLRTATFSPHPMTLAYASPEQVRGRPVSTATDVYGLGLLLYRLLTGRHPYDLPEGSLGSAEQVICEKDPIPPREALEEGEAQASSGSRHDHRWDNATEIAHLRATAVPRLRRQLGGDLGLILLKALRKEPERRYPTAGELAEDLRRYLSGLPVMARPDTPAYRLSRFVSRHRAAVSVFSLVAVLAASLVVLGVHYALTTRAQADRIAQEAATAQEVSDFLLETLRLADPGEGAGDTLTVRAALERGVARHRERLQDRPELRARLLETMAQAYAGLGMEQEATALLEEALALRPRTGEQGDTAIAGTLLGLGATYYARGRFAEALSFNEQAMELLGAIGADSAFIGRAMGAAATDLSRMESLDSARVLGGRALDVLRRHAGEDDPRTLWQVLGYAMILRASEETDSAEALLTTLLPQLDAPEERTGSMGPQILNNLGYLLRLKEQYGEAGALYRRALDQYGRWMAPTERMTTLVNLASVQDLGGDTLAAAQTLMERLAFARESWPRGSWRIGEAATAVARFYLYRQRFADAEPYLRETVEVYSETLGPTHGWTANAESILGSALRELGRYEEAEELLVRGFEDLLAGPGPGDRWTLDALRRVVEFYEVTGRAPEAARYRAMIPSDT